MSETLLDGRITLHGGDCLGVLAQFAPDSIDACVTDPPYHLQSIHKRFAKVGRDDKTWSKSGPHQRTAAGFMNQQWDGGDIAFRPETWAAVYRVLKPGAHLAAFGGTRTFHRMMVAIEDAGFELRDTVMWIYGQGFPKSHNQDGEWVGWGTALKPAWEPIALFRKPLIGTVARNLSVYRTGTINIDACRVPVNPDVDDPRLGGRGEWNIAREKSEHTVSLPPGRHGSHVLGRWPANVVHDGSDEVLKRFPNAPGQQAAVRGNEPSNSARYIYGGLKGQHSPRIPVGDSGSAARFFNTFRDGEVTAERRYTDRGATDFAATPGARREPVSQDRFFYCAKATKAERAGSKHPTVKPVALLRWLARLITPPGGVVLDPFAGTGTTGEAAVREGFRAVLIEREAEYLADIRRRAASVYASPTRRAKSQAELRGGNDNLPLLTGAA